MRGAGDGWDFARDEVSLVLHLNIPQNLPLLLDIFLVDQLLNLTHVQAELGVATLLVLLLLLRLLMLLLLLRLADRCSLG